MDVSPARVLTCLRPRARVPGSAGPLAVLVCCAALLSGCDGPASAPEAAATDRPGTGRAVAPLTGNDLQSDYQRVIKDVLPSVVQIRAGHGLGSGIVYDDKGHIVTNAHVVGNEKTFQVTTANSEDSFTAGLVSSYPEQDLAVVKLDRAPGGLKAVSFADSEKVEVGQIVLAMGSPLGLSSSVTQGIVSATGRTVSEGQSGGGTGATIAGMVQTSAAINPGNSGGALVNLNGQVIGIPTLAATDPELGGSAAPGIGFAIPASMVKTIAGQIVKYGRVVDSGRAALGITGRTVVDSGLQPAGVAVIDVKTGGAAGKAGIRSGDIITKVGDADITTITSLSEALASYKPGQHTTVTFTRDGSGRTVGVTLGAQ
ncbi:trypsin-like peptidase domain-containing protein [Streptomyces sp. Li-HN-5-11]|uniref:S1C family serine protease n=1 Tax=Streptomyces sp. Li-HN-5-11 TaxID=3075432 RepID=UPI0028ACE154|nr:trypsin-like peptidase domain-containing protein [Streptomyces sp. Li-HN-5-11]WNM34618.1 trypsin-like peptidase domain-containing protein [Streptomyces sp. Li-HN-5-11]